MIVLQIRSVQESIRFRWSEWGCAAILAGWGLILLMPAHSFANPTWHVMETWAPEEYWGAAALSIGVCRVGILWRNGRWSQFHRARRVVTWASCFMWSCMLLALIRVGGWNTGIAVYAGYLALDLGCIYIAAYDYARQQEAQRDGAA